MKYHCSIVAETRDGDPNIVLVGGENLQLNDVVTGQLLRQYSVPPQEEQRSSPQFVCAYLPTAHQFVIARGNSIQLLPLSSCVRSARLPTASSAAPVGWEFLSVEPAIETNTSVTEETKVQQLSRDTNDSELQGVKTKASSEYNVTAGHPRSRVPVDVQSSAANSDTVDNQPVTVFLPASAARPLLECVLAQSRCMDTPLSYLMRLAKCQLVEQLHSELSRVEELGTKSLSPKAAHYGSICRIVAPHKSLQRICTVLLGMLEESRSLALPAVVMITEQIHQFVGSTLTVLNLKKTLGMHLEALRLRSLLSIPAEECAAMNLQPGVPHGILFRLAAAGFFYKSSNKVSRFIHCDSGATIAVGDMAKELLQEPALEHNLIAPKSGFELGRALGSIPLEYSLNPLFRSQVPHSPLAASRHDDFVTRLIPCPSPEIPLLASVSKSGVVSVWLAEPLVQLTKVFTFNVFMKRNNTSTTSETVTAQSELNCDSQRPDPTELKNESVESIDKTSDISVGNQSRGTSGWPPGTLNPSGKGTTNTDMKAAPPLPNTESGTAAVNAEPVSDFHTDLLDADQLGLLNQFLQQYENHVEVVNVIPFRVDTPNNHTDLELSEALTGLSLGRRSPGSGKTTKGTPAAAAHVSDSLASTNIGSSIKSPMLVNANNEVNMDGFYWCLPNIEVNLIGGVYGKISGYITSATPRCGTDGVPEVEVFLNGFESKEYMSVVNLQPARPSERDIVMVLPACESRTEAAALAYYGRIAAIQPPSSNSSEKGQYGLVRPLLLDFSHDSSKPLQKIPMKRLFKISPIVQSEFEDRARVAASEGPAADCMISVLLSTDQNYNNSKEGSGLLCLFKRQQRKVQLLQVLQVAAGTNNSTPMVPTCSAYDPESQALVVGCQYTSSESASKRGALLSYHMSQSNPVFSQLYVIGGQDAGLQAALVELETAPCELQLLPKVDRTPRRDASVGQDEVGLEPDHGKAIDRSAGGEFEDLDGDIEDHDCASSSSGSSPPHQRLLAAESNTPKPSHSAGQRAPTSESRSTVDSTQKYTLDSSCIVSLQPNGVITCHEPVTLNEYTQVSVQFPKNKGPFTSLAASATDHANILIATNTHGQSFTQSITLFELDAKDRVLPQNLPDSQLTSLPCLQALHDQIQWEPLSYKAFGPIDGHQRVVTENGGTVLRWRVRNPLQPDGIEELEEDELVGKDESEQQQQQQDDDISSQSHTKSIQPVEVASGDNHGKVVETDNTTTSQSKLSWELELSEPCAVGKVNIHLALRMRQTTSPQPALVFAGSPGNYAEAQTTRMMRQLYRMTVEAWIRPGWDTQAPLTNGSSEEVLLPVVCKVTHPSDGSKPQFELSITQSGGVVMKIWKAKSADEEEVVSATFKSGATSSHNVLKENEWHHLAATLGRDGLDLYIDGDLYASANFLSVTPMRCDKGVSGDSVDKYGPIRIGGDGGDRSFKGCIRQVRIWSIARSQQDIRDWMHHSVPISAAPTEPAVPSKDLSTPGDPSSGLLVCWPLSKNEDPIAMEQQDGVNNTVTNLVLPCQSGAEVGAGPARLVTADAAKWTEVHVPLMDYTPNLTCTIVAFGQDPNCINPPDCDPASAFEQCGTVLVDDATLDSFYVSFDLNAAIARRLHITINHHPQSTLASIDAVTLRLQGKSQSQVADLYHEFLAADDGRFQYFVPLSAMTSVWEFIQSRQLESKLFDLVQTPGVEQNSAAGDTSQSRCVTARRHAAMLLLLDIASTRALTWEPSPQALEKLIRTNLIDCQVPDTTSLAAKLLLYLQHRDSHNSDDVKDAEGLKLDTESGSFNSNFREMLLDTLLNLLDEASSCCQTSKGLREFIGQISACWPTDTLETHRNQQSIGESKLVYERLTNFLCRLGNRLSSKKSPYHNLLRTYFGDYSCPMNTSFADVSATQSLFLPNASGLDITQASKLNGEQSPNQTTTISSTTSGAAANIKAVNGLARANNARIVRVHSKTASATLEGQKLQHGPDQVSLKFSDILQPKKHVIILDLGRRCLIQAANLRPVLEGASNISAAIVTVEAWRDHPPSVGERAILKGNGSEVEIYAYSGFFTYDETGLLGVKSTFPTIVPRNVLIRTGRWYYEVTVVKTTDGVAQVGWADTSFSGDDGSATGVGDDSHSWAFDGSRTKKWNGGDMTWGKKWRDGNVIGCAVDIDAGDIAFSLNGSWESPMGTAFTNVAIDEGLFPAVTGERNFKCKINYGQQPFRYAPPQPDYQPVFQWVRENRQRLEGEEFAHVSTARHELQQRSKEHSSRLVLRRLIQTSKDKPVETNELKANLAHSHGIEARFLRVTIACQEWNDPILASKYYGYLKDNSGITSELTNCDDSSDLSEQDLQLVSGYVAAATEQQAIGDSQESISTRWAVKSRSGSLSHILVSSSVAEKQALLKGSDAAGSPKRTKKKKDAEKIGGTWKSQLAETTLASADNSDYHQLHKFDQSMKHIASQFGSGSSGLTGKLLSGKDAASFTGNLMLGKHLDGKHGNSVIKFNLTSGDSITMASSNSTTQVNTTSTSTSSSKKRSRARITARLGLTLQGISEYVPYLRCMNVAQKAEALQLFHRETLSVLQVAHSMLEDAKHKMTIALERFSVALGSAGGAWDGLDVERDGWSGATQAISETHPMYPSMMEMKSAVSESILVAKRRWEATMARLTWIENLAREEYNIEYALHCAKHSADSPLSDGLVALGNFVKQLDHHRIDAIDTNSESVSRWNEAASEVTKLLLRQMPNPDVIEQQDGFIAPSPSKVWPSVSEAALEQIFAHFCVHCPASAEHRRLSGKLIRRLLRGSGRLAHERSATFATAMLEDHFVTPSATLGPLYAFPERPVFLLVKAIVEGSTGPVAVRCLLSLISKVVGTGGGEPAAITGDFREKLSLVGWSMLLLSHALAVEWNSINSESGESTVKALHKGTVCARCGTSPIIGARFRCVNLADYDLCEVCESADDYPESNFVFLKITKPLPLPPVKDQSGLLVPCGPLLPNLKTKARTFSAKHHSNGNHFQTNSGSHGIHQQGVQWASSSFDVEEGVESGGEGDVEYLEESGVDDDKSDSGSTAAVVKGKSSLKSAGKHKDSKTKGISSMPGKGSKSNHRRTSSRHAQVRFSHGQFNVLHPRIQCDGCGMMPIMGTRYKCVNCDEYNLCARCENGDSAKQHFPLHVFLKLRRPLPLAEGKNPAALIPNHALIPVLLHPSLYPHFHSASEHSASTQVLESDNITTSASGSNGIVLSGAEQGVYDLLEGDSGLPVVKLVRTKSHILRFGRWGKPGSDSTNGISNLVQRTGLDGPNILDSPPATRARKRQFTFEDSDIEAIQVTESGSQSPAPSNGSRNPPTDSFADHQQPVAMVGQSLRRALRIAFSVLSSREVLVPLQLELFLMTSTVLDQLIMRASAADVIAEILQHPRFDDFLHQVAACSQPFVYNAIVRLAEGLCLVESGATAVRRMLRSKAVATLEPPPRDPSFILEVVFVTLSSAKLAPKSWAPQSVPLESQPIAMRKVISEPEPKLEQPLSSATCTNSGVEQLKPRMVAKLLELLEQCPLSSTVIARSWAFAFRILRCFSDPASMLRGGGRLRLQAAVRSVLSAGASMVALVEQDLVDLVSVLLTVHDDGTQMDLQCGLLSVLVDAFLVAQPMNPRLYRKLLQALRESLSRTPEAAVGLNPQHLVALISSVSMALATEAHGAMEALGKDDLDLLYAVLDVVSEPLRVSAVGSTAASVDDSMSAIRRSLLKALTTPNGGLPAPGRALLEWLSDPPSLSDDTKKARLRLRHAIAELLSDVLGREGNHAAPLLDICLDILRDPQAGMPEPTAQVIRALISREPLAHHLANALATRELGLGIDQSSLHVGQRAHSHMMSSVSSSICMALGAQVELLPHQRLAQQHNGRTLANVMSGTGKVDSGSSAAMLSRYDPLNLFSASGQFSAGVTPGAELDISRYCSAGSKKSLGWFADDEDHSGVGVEEATLSVNRLLTEPANSHPKVTVERPFTETDPVWSFYLALPCDAVLQMIEFEFAQDVPLTVHTSKTSGRSLLPSRVTVDIGSALSRLSPGGIAAVFGNPSKGERRHSSVMVRFTSPVTARFARIKVFGPTGDELGRDWISQRSQPRNQDSNTKTAKPPPMVGEQVVRGPDWLWGDQDGDGTGVVVAITAWEGVPNTGVRVHWNSTGMRNIYRWGYREVGSQHSFKYDLMLAADKGEKQKKVIALTNMKIIATVLAPQLSSSALSTSQRSFAFALELLATAARRFQSVQSSLANGENATALARALLEHLPKAYTSKNARAILVLLARHNLSLSQQLLSEVLGPVFATTPAHAALAAEWCTLHDDGTAKRLQALWHYVFGQLDSAEQSPLLLPFLDALAVSVEELVVKSLVLTGKSAGLGFLLAVNDGDQVSSTTNSGLKSLDNSQAARITQILLDRSQRATPDSPGEEAALTLLCTLVRADSSVREQVLAQMSELLKLSELDSDNVVDTNVHVLNVLRIFGVVCSCCQEMASRSLPLFELVAQSTLRQLSRFLDVVSPESMKQSSSQGTGVNVQVVSKTMVALLQSLSDAMHRTEIKNWAAKSLLDPILSSLMQVRFENLAWQSVFGPLLKLIRSMLNLHGANQKLVAERLVGRLEQTQKLNAFELHLFTDAILMREHVTVSIWHPSKIINQLVHGPVSQVAAQDIVPKKSMFRLNPATCGATIELSDDGLVATQIALEKWGVVRADKELPMKGISTWDVLINTSPKGHIFVGVGTSASNLSTYLGNDKYGWGYIGNRGAWHNKHKAKTYGKDFRTGDVVTVVLNMDEGTCSFALNGEDLGVAFTDLQNRQLYPAFALYQKGDQLTITRCSLASCSPPVVQDVSQVSSVDDKLPSGVSSLLDPKSRLRFHRPGPVYTLPCETTVGRVLEKVGVVTGNRLPTDQHTRTSSVTSARGGESICTSENQSSGVAHSSANVGDVIVDSSHRYDDDDDIDGTSQWYLIQQCQGTVSEDVSRSSEEVKQAFDESETSTLGVHVPPFRAGVNGTSATRQMGEVVLENSHGTELIDIVKETQALRSMIGGAPAVSALSIQLSPASENDKIPQYLCMSPINSFRGTSSVTTLATPSDRPFVTVDGDRMLLGTSPVKQTSGSKLQDESTMEEKPSFTNTFMNANGTDTSPVLEILASLGGLTRVVRLIKQQWFPNQLNNNGQVAGSGDDQEQTSGSITAGSAIAPRRSDVPNEDTVVPSPGAKPFWLKEWLVELEGNLSIPGFPLAFARQKSCIALMLKAMGVTQMPWIDTYSLDSDVDEPLGSLVEALTALFTLQEPIKGKEIRERAVVVGTVDRLLLRLGTLQAETPRDRTRTDKFDHSMGTQRETKHSSKPGSSGEDLEVDSSVSKHDEGEVSLSGLTTPKAPKLKKGVGMESDKSKGVEHDTSVSISSTNTDKKQLWKPGYGHGSIDTTRLEREHEQKQRLKLERTLSTLDCLVVFLEMNTEMKSSMSESFWIELYECFEASCFLKLIMSFFFGTTVKVILDQEAIYRRLLKVVLLISKCPKLSGLLGSMEGVYRSVQELMVEMYHLGQELEEDILGVDDASEASEEHDVQLTNSKADSQADEEQSKKTGGEEEKLNSESLTDTEVATWATANHATLPLLINHTKHSVDAAMAKLEEQRKQEAAAEANKISESDVGDDVEQNPEGNTATVDSKALGIDDLHKIYEDALRPHLFGGRDMRDNDGKYLHHYSTQIDEDLKGKVSKSRHRRLARELKALAKSLPLHFGSTIAVRIDHTRPFVAQAIISGPANTPYDSGVFEFDIYFPPEYPSDPPKVNLMTTGQGTVRFNPNLYNNGKVCLSLLGTWRGGATGSENWTKNSSLWQVLVSIQSAILGSEFPYFNEPGVESQWGTEQGDLQKRIHSNGGYERLRVATIQHAMVGHLRNPPSGFEDAIREHFSIKRRYIIESVCERWLREARQSDTKGHFKALQRQISDLKVELSKFPTALCDEIVVVSGQLPNSPLSESVSVDGEVGVLALSEENAHDSSDQQHTNADIAAGSAGEPKQAETIASDVVGELAAKTVSNAINMFSGATSDVEMSQNVSVDENTVESKGTTSSVSENQVDKKEGETLATSASASDTFAEKLNALKLMCPQFPKGLLRVALEQMEASTQGSDWGSVNNDDAHLNGAAAWLFTEGEQYLNEHIELFQEK